MHGIRNTIRNYLGSSETVSDYTLLCFAGMIETGEATEQDFREVAGNEIADRVIELVDRFSQEAN